MPPSISPSRTPLPRRRCKQKRERSPRFFKKLCKKRPVHPHGPFFVCGIDAGRGGDEPLPSFRFAKCHLPQRWRPWQKGQLSSSPVNGRKKSADKRKTFRLCQSLSLSGEVARRSRDGEGRFQDEPSQSRCARQLFPFLSPAGDIFPRPGEVFRRESPWQNQQVSSSPVNGRKKPAVKQQTFRPCQSLSLSGEVARRSRDGEGRFQNSLSPSAAGSSCRCIAPLANTKSPPESSPAGF